MLETPGVATDIRACIEAQLASLVALRHDLHRCPELMFQEHATSRRVVAELEALGIEHITGLGCPAGQPGTGVLAHLPATTGTQGPAVALRADMDALPIEEQTGAPYASETPGVMHACGHDGHTTILLGVARVLASLEHRPNPVTLVFQPAEEGGGGGEKMCAAGALRGAGAGGLGTPVARIYGLHGWPRIPLGDIATRPGPLLAATDEITITIEGTQGHAAYPHLAADPVVASAHVITALQTIASRRVSPLDSVIVTIGSIHGGSANNVIPASVTLVGTVRTLSAETRELAKREVFRIAEQTASAHGTRARVDWESGYPVTSNDPAEAARVCAIASDAVGPERVTTDFEPSMGGEDFSYYGQHVPACFYLVGLCPPGADPDSVPQLHQATFDFNDDAIGVGVEMMVRLALS
ncbi:MAG: hippurate hydrolase [Phycisphaeraceae bacterium]|nr:MAG: hippurate hydrolase [Phycisphaeraceae bacterium]